MTPERFRELIDAYGADPKRWPESERLGALALLQRTPALAAELDAARRLDALIDAWPVAAAPADPAHLVARATRASQEPVGNVVPLAPRRRAPATIRTWVRGAALAAAGICGLIVGMSDPTMTPGSANADIYDIAQLEDSAW